MREIRTCVSSVLREKRPRLRLRLLPRPSGSSHRADTPARRVICLHGRRGRRGRSAPVWRQADMVSKNLQSPKRSRPVDRVARVTPWPWPTITHLPTLPTRRPSSEMRARGSCSCCDDDIFSVRDRGAVSCASLDNLSRRTVNVNGAIPYLPCFSWNSISNTQFSNWKTALHVLTVK